MYEFKTPLEFIGLAISILGVFAGCHILVERVFNYSLFKAALVLIPAFLRLMFPSDENILWFENRINKRTIFESWDLSLIFLFLLLLTFALSIGFWLFLILRLLSIFYFPVLLLVLWGVIILLNNIYSACNQAALRFKILYPNKTTTKTDILTAMQQEPGLTFKLLSMYFWSNWIRTPLVTFILLLTIFLVVLLYWPCWIINLIRPNNKLRINEKKTKTNYFSIYSAVLIVTGIIINFIAS
ncbi:MAG TPA: hypothetical protein VMW86_05330 [Dehalococcoidales bacterium]|nr:hypothetical protein [Dehalococcoidales bacterium]